ncbi:MAG: preprotein translocase subunit YajC [Candidatus Fimenecus sp.]
MFNVLLPLEATSTTGSTSIWPTILLMVALFAVMYFFTIRPQKKQQKKEQEMRDGTQVGDEITTIGGIMGRVVTVKEDSLIIETGADRNKMKIARWAIQMNNTANEKLQAEREAAKAAQEKEKEEKAKKKSKKED